MTLGGTCNPRFDPLRELFAAKLESGEDLGASLAVNIDGEMVVDVWGGCPGGQPYFQVSRGSALTKRTCVAESTLKERQARNRIPAPG